MTLKQLIKPFVPAPLLAWYSDRGLLAQKGRRVWRGEAGGEPEMRLLPALCDPAKPSVDIGANEGGYAWHMRRLSRGLHVFEPLPELARRLSNGFALDRRVAVHQVALSDRVGTVQLRVPIQGDRANTGLATIEPGNDLHGAGLQQFDVPMRTLDSYALQNIGFIKIDVEGHELAVLRGATGLIEASHPAFLIEAQDLHRADAVTSITSFLEGFGYHGMFLLAGQLHDIAAFDLALHQHPDALDAMMDRRPGHILVNNFIFVTDPDALRRRAQGLELFR